MAATKLLLTDFASTVNHVPSNYIRPISDRPNLADVQTSDDSIPVIDLQGLYGPNHSVIVHQIGQACQEYGFLQVKNHGVPEAMIHNMLSLAREFFRLPESQRLKNFSDDPSKANRLSTSFNVKTEKVANWRDFLRLHCLPLEDHVPEWPSNPPSFRKVVAEYCTSVRGLTLRLLEAISESLGLKRDHIDKTLSKHDDVPGLQVLINGKWVAVNPIPNTFIINIGDQMQVISNDRYKSVLHRAVVNCEKERMSIPTFYCPSPDAVIGPAEELIDDENPAVYRNFTYAEYYEKFWNRGLATECCLDMFKASNA
ncbi:hypothetical protein SLA2020_371370 [Shorea laevis]